MPPPSDLTFTVVVPTHGRSAGLIRCLGALAAQTLPASAFDVIVVDDGSLEDPGPIVEALRPRLRVELLRQAQSGPAGARNAGARRASGRFLAFTDDDCAPAPGWLAAFGRAFDRGPDRLLGGATVNGVRGNVYSDASQSLVAYLYEYFNARHVRFLTSNNMAVPAGRFREMGGFCEGFRLAAAEDRDFCERWEHAGGAMAFVPDAVVEHHHALGLRTFWRQHFNYGRGAYGFHRLRAARGREPMRIEPLRFYTGLVCAPLSPHRPLFGAGSAALMALSQAANAAGYYYEAYRRRNRAVRHDLTKVPDPPDP